MATKKGVLCWLETTEGNWFPTWEQLIAGTPPNVLVLDVEPTSKDPPGLVRKRFGRRYYDDGDKAWYYREIG